jgi:hypothetical protein
MAWADSRAVAGAKRAGVLPFLNQGGVESMGCNRQTAAPLPFPKIAGLEPASRPARYMYIPPLTASTWPVM